MSNLMLQFKMVLKAVDVDAFFERGPNHSFLDASLVAMSMSVGENVYGGIQVKPFK